ncbi:M16 family metallopeptidase [Terribacillus halophilus]|jgi:predicted Zn-dependent peptidase|uniref:M16 family metallopeptidase n=1 Tax=Terribacillus halophilus TaxID=361279 RepID=UPI0021196329|nr:pitrilysin family protein [Terribacillus halophilus]
MKEDNGAAARAADWEDLNLLQRHTCKNGLRVVVENMPSVRSVTIGIWILTGSRNEEEKNNGLSHFLEHMFFKGTKKRSAKELAEAFDAIGGMVNAFTSKEYTCYYAKVLDTHKEFALEVLADMFFESQFAQEEIEKEQKVVLEEIKMAEDTPDDIIHDWLAEAAYAKHPLGLPILGTESTVMSFNSDSVRQYKESHYVPEKIVISVAGNVDDSFMKEVEHHFGSFEADSAHRELEIPPFFPNTIRRAKETEQAHLTIGYNGLKLDDPASYSLMVVNNVLGGSMSSRLFQDVREDKGLAYSVFSYHSTHQDSGMLTIYAGTGKEQLDELQETIRQTTEKLKADGLTEKELQNTKEQLKGNYMLGLESTNSRMSRNGRNELMLGKHPSFNELIEKIDNVTMDDVNGIIHHIFGKEQARAIVAPK